MIKGLPERLQDLRLQYGYSQKQVAQKIDASPSIISAYESGERTPSTEVLLALSYIYHCSMDYLLGKQTNEPMAILDISNLTNEQIRAIQEVIKAFENK